MGNLQECVSLGRQTRPEIKSLSLTMKQQPIRVPGPHFRVHAPGDTFAFTHLVSGKEYVLTVQELEQQTLPKNSFASDCFCYPTHYTAMAYSLSPEPDEHIMINDCGKSDRPLEIGQKKISSPLVAFQVLASSVVVLS